MRFSHDFSKNLSGIQNREGELKSYMTLLWSKPERYPAVEKFGNLN